MSWMPSYHSGGADCFFLSVQQSTEGRFTALLIDGDGLIVSVGRGTVVTS